MIEALNINYLLANNSSSNSQKSEFELLISDCIAQKRSAQRKLYDIYAPAAYGVVKRYMYDNEQAAQEILNDAFFKIFTKLDQYTFQGAFEGWIRKIVVNTVADYLRKNLKKEQHKQELKNDEYVDESTPIDNVSHKELLKIVQTLPEVQLAVFNLYVFEQFSHKEIATALSLSENNSRWYLNDARKRLKEKLNVYMK